MDASPTMTAAPRRRSGRVRQGRRIADRTLRAKTGAERGVTDDDLRAAADALDLRAAALIQHAQKLRDEAGA